MIPTNNIISTPNITGNVGSCNSSSVSVHSGATLFREFYTNVITNSCTGQTSTYQNWSFSLLSCWLMFIFFSFILSFLVLRPLLRFVIYLSNHQ